MSDFAAETNQVSRSDDETLRELFAGMQTMNAQIQAEQQRIDRLKAETHDLRDETLRLRAVSHAILARLGEQV